MGTPEASELGPVILDKALATAKALEAPSAVRNDVVRECCALLCHYVDRLLAEDLEAPERSRYGDELAGEGLSSAWIRATDQGGLAAQEGPKALLQEKLVERHEQFASYECPLGDEALQPWALLWIAGTEIAAALRNSSDPRLISNVALLLREDCLDLAARLGRSIERVEPTPTPLLPRGYGGWNETQAAWRGGGCALLMAVGLATLAAAIRGTGLSL